MKKNKLQDLLEYSYQKVPYFNNIINKNDISPESFNNPAIFEKIPPFSKKDIIESGYTNFISIDYLDEQYRLTPSSRIKIERTSGTTMESMEIPWDRKNYISSVRSHWQYRKSNGDITPLSPMLSAITLSPNEYYLIENNNILVNTNNLCDECIKAVYAEIVLRKIEWIYTFGSVIYVLLRKIEKLGLPFPHSIKYIEVIGEPLLSHYKTYIEKATGLRVYNAYGCTETNGIAYSCSQGNFHTLDENVHVEILYNGKTAVWGQKGNVCVTGLHNRTMPFIRYLLTDIAEMHEGRSCTCGLSSNYLTLHITRLPKVLLLDDLSIYPNSRLYFSFDNIFAITTPTCKHIPFNLRYKDIHTYEICFDICSTNFSEERISNEINNLISRYKLEDINIILSFKSMCQGQSNGFLVLKDD